MLTSYHDIPALADRIRPDRRPVRTESEIRLRSKPAHRRV